MATNPCPDCGKEVSDRAAKCPACGRRMQSIVFAEVLITLCGTVAALAVAGFFFAVNPLGAAIAFGSFVICNVALILIRK